MAVDSDRISTAQMVLSDKQRLNHQKDQQKSIIIFGGIFLIFCSSFLFSGYSSQKDHSSLQSGDIVFQSSQSSQSEAIRLATHSIYTHCGIVFVENNKVFIYEAVQPVKVTSINDWIKKGKDYKYVVKRLKNASTVLTKETLTKMKACAEKFKNKDYDIYFDWSDERIYCSELVWKVYKQGANIEVGKLQKLKDFDLTSVPVKTKLKEKYGTRIPLDETVISPGSIFESKLLETVEDK